MNTTSRINSLLGDINEAAAGQIEGVALKKASSSDRAKGESYVVYSKSTKKVLTEDTRIASGLTRNCAKELAAVDDDYNDASASWAADNKIS